MPLACFADGRRTLFGGLNVDWINRIEGLFMDDDSDEYGSLAAAKRLMEAAAESGPQTPWEEALMAMTHLLLNQIARAHETQVTTSKALQQSARLTENLLTRIEALEAAGR
jgi:hypothetical protein